MDLLFKYIRKFLMKHDKLRVLVRKLHIWLKHKRYEKITKGIETDENLVLFETFMGRQYGCNPKAIYEYIIGEHRYDNFSFIWVLNNPETINEIPQNHRVKTVKLRTDEYYKSCAKAKYIITNSNLDYGIIPKPEQVLLQTWHGTPLKRLRCDIEVETGNALNTLEEIRHKNDIDVVRYDYFISPSAFTTEKFINAFNLKNLNKEDIIIETGYPRNDILYNYDKEYTENVKRGLQLPEGKKVILYAPTFRDNQHDGSGYTYDTHIDFDALKNSLGDEYIILFRAHYFVANQFDFSKYEDFVYDVSSLDDITPLHTISDMLITDYSSVFFDFANTGKPILFYMYDLEEYASGIRGFYINVAELPGPIVKTQDELVKAILSDNREYDNKYEDFNKKYNYNEDGNSSRRVAEIVFGR